MFMRFKRVLQTALLCGLAGWGLAAQAQTNLLTNGSFELDSDGKVFPNITSSSSWRWFAVGDATGSATVRTAAATDGAVGLELVRTVSGTPGVGDSGLDKWEDQETIPASRRVYQFLMDAKDAGVYGGSTYTYMQLQFPLPTASPFAAYDPGPNFETFGICAVSGTSGTLSVRATTSPDNSSVYLDNLRVYDVTDGNRVINGGFENSATRMLSWRAFSLNPGEFLTTFSSDANSGLRAARIERTFVGTGDSDGGLDTDASRIPVLPGELLTLSIASKKVSGDAATRLSLIWAEFDATGTFTGQSLVFFNPSTTDYTTFTSQFRVAATTTHVNASFRVGNSVNSVRHLGAYLLDDLAVQRGTDANLLDNSSFENQTAGDFNGQINGWRVPFTDTAGTVTVRAAAATHGNLGVELVHGTGTFFLDRWDSTIPPSSKPGIYKLLVDAKDGGVFGGQDSFDFRGVIHGPPYLEYATQCEPGAQTETFGLTIPAAADANGIDVRLTPSGTPDQSFLADNVRVTDVTRANRVVNGGFENSTTRPVSWRAFSLEPGEFSSSLSSDAHSGTRALRIERTGTVSDGAVDLASDLIFVQPGETLQVSVSGKKLSGDGSARLYFSIAQYDVNATYMGPQLQTDVALNPDTGAYSTFTVPVTIDAGAKLLYIGLRVGNNLGGNIYPGAYLVDDVSVVRNQAPVFTGATLSYNSDQSVILVTTNGWSDADGDAEQYLYQWKRDGVVIAGATAATFPRATFPGGGVITCDVTAYDGITRGTTITAAFAPSLATVIEAGQTLTPLTIDGSNADWATVPGRTLPMSVFGQGGEDLLVNIRFAWDATYLYTLVEEVQDDNQGEAANQDDFRDQAWMFDSVSLWFSFRNDATLLNGAFNPWFGFSSTGRSDLFTARNNNGNVFEETALVGASVKTGGTFAAHNRVIEAAIKWSDVAAVTNDDLEPFGGLTAAIQQGYAFGCEPLLVDNGFPGQAFRTGQTHIYPDGNSADSVDVLLVDSDFSLTAAKSWQLFE